MDLTGHIAYAGQDMFSQKDVLAINLDQHLEAKELEPLYEKKIDFSFKPHKEKRSLNANAYYWTLLNKLAKVRQIPRTELHNLLLQQYGHLQKVAGQVLAVQLPDNQQTLREVRNQTEYHLAPTAKLVRGKNGMNRVYLLMRGSSTYDTTEMSQLIQGLITECKKAGLPDAEIMTPLEKKQLAERYGIRIEEIHFPRKRG